MPNSVPTFLGVVEELWRYRLTMIGEQLNATEVTASGLLGDRAYALRDTSDGRIATAKNPRKWPNGQADEGLKAAAQELRYRGTIGLPQHRARVT